MAVVHKTLLCVVGLLLAGAGCSDGPAPGRALGSESNGNDASATAPRQSSSTTGPVTTLVSSEVRPDAVASLLAAMNGADPVLVPTSVPTEWTAVVTMAYSAFKVTYTGQAGELVELSISEPNPPPPTANTTERTGFRGDPHGEYQSQDSSDPGTQRFLVWNERGEWIGDPQITNSARDDSVPYFLRSTGVTETVFWQIADSLAPVAHATVAGVPTVIVEPNQGLHDGQTVTVTVQGFAPNDRVHLSECAERVSVSSEGCGPQLAAQPFIDTDNTGSGTINFVVHSTASAKPHNLEPTRPCTDQCLLVATTNLPNERPGTVTLEFE